MKKFLIGLFALGAFSSYAGVECKEAFNELSAETQFVGEVQGRLMNIKAMDKRKLLSDHESMEIDLIEESVARHERNLVKSKASFVQECL